MTYYAALGIASSGYFGSAFAVARNPIPRGRAPRQLPSASNLDRRGRHRIRTPLQPVGQKQI
jgi:hypothetical protein